jgi:predicted nucleotidyltransferase component of viral defense system
MISAADLHRWAARQGLRFEQTEKDYVILLVLSALSETLQPANQWVFKGGTCLRHCYYAGYRFSEDIDFTCVGAGDDAAAAQGVLNAVAAKVRESTGVVMLCNDLRADEDAGQTEIPVEYSRGGPLRRDLPTIKVHLSFKEPLLVAPEVRLVQPSYDTLNAFPLMAYSKIEIVAEKLRCLLQQQAKWPRPRDLYDLWYITCSRAESFDRSELRRLFTEKCRVRDVSPDPAGLCSTQLYEWNREAWVNQLMPMVQNPPDYDRVWSEWTDRCQALL